MKKNSFYFPHDYHAIHDPKCAALIQDFGMAGYGIFWCLIEILHEQGGKIEKFPKLYDGLAAEIGCEKPILIKLIEALLQDFCLLKQDEKYIWSERVLRNIEERNEKYLIKAQAGRIGGLRSGEVRKSKQNEAVLEANELKESKGKEKKYIKPQTEESFLQTVRINYPHADFDLEMRRIDGWLAANPHRKKTRMFIINWFNRIEIPLKKGETNVRQDRL